MSNYENYEKTSDDYARVRQPVGLEIMLGAFCRYLYPAPLSSLNIIDIGCGAGVYMAPLSLFVKSIVGVDISEKQLVSAKKRLTNLGRDNFTLINCDARNIELQDNCFDAAIMSLVLHHIDKYDDGDGVDNITKVMSEVARILRPGGIFLLAYCSKKQVYDGAWYCRLIPEASAKLADKHRDFTVIDRIASEQGLNFLGRHVPLDGVLQGESYFDDIGPLKSQWRNADSIFSLLSGEEMEQMETTIKELQRNGSSYDFMLEHEIARRSNGHLTIAAFRRHDNKHVTTEIVDDVIAPKFNHKE